MEKTIVGAGKGRFSEEEIQKIIEFIEKVNELWKKMSRLIKETMSKYSKTARKIYRKCITGILYKMCKNNKLVKLALYHKKARVRKKNFNRIMQIYFKKVGA